MDRLILSEKEEDQQKALAWIEEECKRLEENKVTREDVIKALDKAVEKKVRERETKKGVTTE